MVAQWVSAAIGVFSEAMLNNPTVVEAFARAELERARAELRQGKYEAGDAILESTMARLDRVVQQRQTSQSRLDLTRAVALSLKGQSLEQSGQQERAAESFADAAELFRQLPEESLSPRDHSDYGVALAALGSDAEARREIETARAGNGGTPEAARHLARLLFEAGEVHAAEMLLRESLLTLPDDADALALLGRIQAAAGEAGTTVTFSQAAYMYLERGRARDALRTLDLLGGAVDDYAEPNGLRAEALRLDGQFEAAVAEYDRALAAEPADPWLLGGRGAALAGLGRLDEARRDLDRAVQLAPASVSLLLAAGEVAFRVGDIAVVREYALRAVAADSTSPAACDLLARAELAAGSLGAALESARRARALDKSDDVGLLRLNAQLERMIGATETAAELFRQLCARASSLPDDHLTLAAVLVELEQMDGAIRVIEAATRRWDHHPVLLARLGELLIDGERPQEAVQVLRRATDLDPGSALAYAQLATALAELGGMDEALREIGRAAELDPVWPEPHRIKAILLMRAERWPEAAAAAQELLKRDPESVDALRILALERLQTDKVDQAVALLKRARRANPDSPEVSFLLAQVFADPKPGKALDILSRPPAALDKQPGLLCDWLLLRGHLQLQQERWLEAEVDFAHVIELRPDLADAWAARGEAAQGSGRRHQALADTEEALQLDPRHVLALCTRAQVLIQLGRVDEGRADLEEALRVEPDYSWGLYLLAQITSDPDAARALIDRALAAAPTSRELLTERAWLEVRFGDYQRALQMFDELLETARDKEALTGRANALRLLGRFEEAVTVATEAAGLGQDKQTLQSLGLARLATDDVTGAVEALTRAHDADSDDGGISADLGYALAAAERTDEALAVLDQALVANPGDTSLLGQLANLLNGMGAFSEAAHCARRGAELDPADTGLWSSLGWALQYGDPPDLPQAEDAYCQAWDRQPADDPDPWVLSSVADVHYLQGDPRAADEYQRALEIADGQRLQDPGLVSVTGWCQFRLGDLQSAAQAFLECSSTEALAGSDVFDLALVMLCDGRHRRARVAYLDAIARMDTRHPFLRRGYLLVARTDLRQALVSYPDLRGLGIAEEVDAALGSALAGLPSVPDLAALRRPGEPSTTTRAG
jgi:tetratricopeptide (TPR) repeat protein